MTTTSGFGRVTLIDDIELYCEIRGSGEPLVLLHGFSGTGRDWQRVFDLEELARDYQVIVVDLRGHGRSTNPAGSFTHRQCAADLARLLDELGIGRCKAIGLSLGANTLLHLTTREPDRTDTMVLVAPAIYYPKAARALMLQAAVTSPGAEDWRRMREIHERGDDQIRALLRQPAGFAATYDDMNFTPPYLSTITAHTLIVNGDRDPLLPIELFVELHRAIANCALWIVPGAGHGPIFGEWREQFARTALGFLRSG